MHPAQILNVQTENRSGELYRTPNVSDFTIATNYKSGYGLSQVSIAIRSPQQPYFCVFRRFTVFKVMGRLDSPKFILVIAIPVETIEPKRGPKQSQNGNISVIGQHRTRRRTAPVTSTIKQDASNQRGERQVPERCWRSARIALGRCECFVSLP